VSRGLSNKVTPVLLKTVTDILVKNGIPSTFNDKWSIIDVDGPLVMIHYNGNFNPTDPADIPLRKIRGIIIDINTGAYFTNSYGYVEDLPVESLLINNDNIVSFLGQNSQELSFKETDVKFAVGYESSFVKVFKHNGKIYFSTSTKIDGTKSHWGNKETFYEAFLRLSLIRPEDLFGPEETSPYTYCFVIIGPTNLCSMLHENRVIYAGCHQCWDIQVLASKPTDPYYSILNFEKYEPTNLSQPEPSVLHTESYDRPMIGQNFISVENVNKLLYPEYCAPRVASDNPKSNNREVYVQYGDGGSVKEVFWSNPLANTENHVHPFFSVGNFVIMFLGSGSEMSLFRLVTQPFLYRMKMTGNDCSPYHHWVWTLQSITRKDATPDAIIPLLKEDGQLFDVNKPEEFRQMWFITFYNSVGPSRRDEVSKFYDNYMSDINAVTAFIKDVYPKITTQQFEILKSKNIMAEATRSRISAILTQANKKVEENLKRNVIAKVNTLLFNAIKHQLINYESPDSCYKMIKTIERFNKLPDALLPRPIQNDGNRSDSYQTL